jgi:hypothetical protein
MRGAGEEGILFETVAAFDVWQQLAPVGGQRASPTVTLPREQSDSELSRFDKLGVEIGARQTSSPSSQRRRQRSFARQAFRGSEQQVTRANCWVYLNF